MRTAGESLCGRLQVREFAPEQRAQLLHFATGSARVPAAGFANLRGYNGLTHRFRIELGAADTRHRLPSASTCFNCLKLPPYATLRLMRERVMLALDGARDFDEGATAV